MEYAFLHENSTSEGSEADQTECITRATALVNDLYTNAAALIVFLPHKHAQKIAGHLK